MPSDWVLLGRIAMGLLLAFLVGFEREVRGSPAGDRTFGLVGLASTATTAVVAHNSPQALAGVITGVGFIGAGVVIHTEQTFIRGITTAAAIFAVAAIGIVVGSGHIFLGAATTAGVLLILEVRYLPVFRVLDGRRYQSTFRQDTDPPGPIGPGPGSP
jgi:putative Mg2+ transporter-C (MgtC) family protein